MRTEADEGHVSAEDSDNKPKFPIVIILAVVIGVLLTFVIASSIVFVQQRSALKAEVVEAKKKLKKKELALADMRKQLEELSLQMLTLKEYAIASSDSAQKGKASASNLVADKIPATSEMDASKTGSHQSVVAVPLRKDVAPKKQKAATAEPASVSCELIGKSPKEQEEILRRCVGLMDGTSPEKSRR